MKLTGWLSSYTPFDGSSWETLFQKKVPYLTKLEFSYRVIVTKENFIDDLQSIIASYQTSYWLEEKHWYTNCEYMKDRSTLKLYSIPFCETKFILDSHSEKMTYSSFLNIQFNTKSLMDNVTYLHINSIPSMISPTSMYFSNINELTLCITDKWPQDTTEYLSHTINLSYLTTLSLNSEPNEYSMLNAAILLYHLFERAVNLRSLSLAYPLSHLVYQPNMEWLFTMISNRIKHLKNWPSR